MYPRYYRFGGEPMGFMAEWGGLPPAATRRGSRELGEANFYESAAPASRRFRPLAKSYKAYQKNPFGHEMILMSRSDAMSGDDLVPLRESGPEPLDPGEMPIWQEAYMEDPLAQPVGATGDLDVYDSLPPTDKLPTIGQSSTQTGPKQGAVASMWGGLSRNEKLLVGAAAAVGGLMLYKRMKKSKKGRRRR